jgi:ABC-type antimicrobial peptide transport system permease subunit
MPLPDLIPAPRILPSVIVTTFLILVGVGIAAGIVPARIAARIPPAIPLRAT